jgi:hypothetical protein
MMRITRNGSATAEEIGANAYIVYAPTRISICMNGGTLLGYPSETACRDIEILSFQAIKRKNGPRCGGKRNAPEPPHVALIAGCLKGGAAECRLVANADMFLIGDVRSWV